MSDTIKLWFFRDLHDDQRLKLFGLFGLPVDEIGNHHGRQLIALRHIGQKLVEMVQKESTPTPSTNAVGHKTPEYATAEAAFAEYFVRNYPGPDTIIFDPNWHAPKLFYAAFRALAWASAGEKTHD
ncbi:hypothetical protein [Rhizobium sp. L51/94]|uniref:hypothetical protein n=1 Tax=Rhizobium sp. L51/94 TaxID=2819999 RepID=UPI001C5AB277|nr:hypothetical protein [Rhizobium sp. L51/94]QXZ80336.1 hypothetical protein J5274_06435 [Rhizobium sp. L51/94]